MTKRARPEPRKLPRQTRSKATVDAIATAAARILARDGYEGANVNTIAELAGVGIGSALPILPEQGGFGRRGNQAPLGTDDRSLPGGRRRARVPADARGVPGDRPADPRRVRRRSGALRRHRRRGARISPNSSACASSTRPSRSCSAATSSFTPRNPPEERRPCGEDRRRPPPRPRSPSHPRPPRARPVRGARRRDRPPSSSAMWPGRPPRILEQVFRQTCASIPRRRVPPIRRAA